MSVQILVLAWIGLAFLILFAAWGSLGLLEVIFEKAMNIFTFGNYLARYAFDYEGRRRAKRAVDAQKFRNPEKEIGDTLTPRPYVDPE